MSQLSILGRTLDANLTTPSVESWLGQHWHFPEHAADVVPYRIQLDEVERAPTWQSGATVRVALHRFSLTCEAGPDGWRFGDEAAGVQLQLLNDGSRIALWGASRADTDATVFPSLFVSIAESLRASGLLPLHAAVVVRDGRATALAGPSGVGKSTTLWRALDAGWLPLAEDFAWLDPETLIVRGWDRGVRLTADTRERFARDIPASSFRAGEDGKFFLPYERFRSPSARTAVLDRLLVLERDDTQPAGLSPLGARGVVRVWWEAIGVPLDTTVRERVAIEIALLVSRVQRFTLRLGPGPPSF